MMARLVFFLMADERAIAAARSCDQTVRFSLLMTSAIEKKENYEDGPLIPCQQLWAWGSNRQLFDRQGIDRRWRHEILFQLWALEELR